MRKNCFSSKKNTIKLGGSSFSWMLQKRRKESEIEFAFWSCEFLEKKYRKKGKKDREKCEFSSWHLLSCAFPLHRPWCLAYTNKMKTESERIFYEFVLKEYSSKILFFSRYFGIQLFYDLFRTLTLRKKRVNIFTVLKKIYYTHARQIIY